MFSPDYITTIRYRCRIQYNIRNIVKLRLINGESDIWIGEAVAVIML